MNHSVCLGSVLEGKDTPVYRGSNDYYNFPINSDPPVRVKTRKTFLNPFVNFSFVGRYVENGDVFRPECCRLEAVLYDDFIDLVKYHVNVNDTFDINYLINQHQEVALWYHLELYKFIFDRYLVVDVFQWKYETCRLLRNIFDEDPFVLSYTCPFDDMDGVFASPEHLLNLYPLTEDNRWHYEAAVTAELFCFQQMKHQLVQDIQPEVLQILTVNEFLTIQGEKVFNKKFYDLYLDVKEDLQMFPVNTYEELCHWCQAQGNAVFLSHPRMIVDQNAFTFPIVNEIPRDCERSIHIFRIDLWTLSDLGRVFEYHHPSTLLGVGFHSSHGNRFGYNVMHFQHKPPPFQRSFSQELTMRTLNTCSERCGDSGLGA